MKLSEKPAPIPVFFRGSETPCGYACGVCKHLWKGADEAASFADRCCPPLKCEHEGCEKERLGHYVYCAKHCFEAKRARVAERVREAKRVPAADWKDPVSSEYNDERWFWNVDDLLDSEEDPPSWAWGMVKCSLVLDADDILTSATENASCGEAVEEAAFDGKKDLQEALDAWLEAYPVTWWEATAVVVVIDPAKFAEEFPGLAESGGES